MNKWLPFVSCYCPTYGRPRLLEEAIESFLRQDYTGAKELVVLNDHVEQQLIFDHPEVRIINSGERIVPVARKFNECVDLCNGEVLFPWDDDDIYLPWKISRYHVGIQLLFIDNLLVFLLLYHPYGFLYRSGPYSSIGEGLRNVRVFIFTLGFNYITFLFINIRFIIISCFISNALTTSPLYIGLTLRNLDRKLHDM